MAQVLTRSPEKLKTGSNAFKDFKEGARDTFPLLVGALPFGIIFGTLAAANGLSFAATLGMSIFVFAGSAQFIALGMIGAGTAWPLIVATTFIVNLRHMLYCATLLPWLTKMRLKWQIPLCFWLTDETFAVAVRRYQDGDKDHDHRWYHLGSSLAMYSNWLACTYIGLAAGQRFPQITEYGLDFAMPATFIGMLIPYLKNRAMWAAVLISGLVSILAFTMPHKLGLMCAAFAGIAGGIFVESKFKEDK
ncbi:AzlC family ABC transporter permease [Desulfobacterales bacterium HSG16]|nr:AzlC family ABC transporter permease [Desulfobacterales bacterium HSG16]